MQLLAAAGLVALSGFFSGAETAIYRAHWVRLTNQADRKLAGAGLALRLLGHREATVITTLVGNNLVNVFASVLVSEFFARVLGPGFTPVGVVALVALTLAFGEFAPKALAQSSPNLWLRRSAGPLAGAMVLFAPAVLLLAGLARLLTRSGPGPSAARPALTRQDLLSALRQRERECGSPEGTPVSSLAARLFRLSGSRVGEAAIPLARVRSAPEGATREELLAFVRRHGFSRIPLYRGAPENITGVVFAKDLLAGGPVRVRPARRIAAGARIMEVLEQMQRRGEHLAAVESGGRVTGIVTLEDILEELVGEIRSED
ncbi:MAG: CNNM domain-containing protein [bacterium]